MLHDGSIAEMKTGEGKTLVSTLAAYLNALRGEGVHGMLVIVHFLFSELKIISSLPENITYALCKKFHNEF